MNRPLRLASVASILVCLCLALACGGGGGDRDTPPITDLALSFVPSAPTPGTMTISMSDSSIAGDVLDLDILVTDIDDFFGAGFRVYFDDTALTYNGFASSGSLILVCGAGCTDFRAELAAPGEIFVTATTQGPQPGVPASATPEFLIQLTFTAELDQDSSTAISFDTPGTPAMFRTVETCPTATGVCDTVDDGDLTWAGGTVVVM
ncbi:MAG: hypothetical protein GY716_02510 [bacterium]|nr:hypothetical protein [bacterium]